MIVQELFQKILNTQKSKEEFVKYYLRYIDNNIKGTNKKQKLLKLVDDICNYTDVKEDKNLILFFIPDYPKQDKEDCVNTFLVHKDELFKEENIIDSTKIMPYAYEFQLMRDILGYKVSDACLHAFKGKYRALGSILYEMTFFGYSMEAQEQSALDEMESIDSSLKEIEEHPEQLIKWDDVKVEFEEKYKIKARVKPIHEEMFDEQYYQAENIFYNKVFDLLCQLERDYIRNEQRN